MEDLGFVMSVVGATGSSIVSYLLPGLCYFRLRQVNPNPKADPNSSPTAPSPNPYPYP